jgi:hypothetical protein
MPKLKTRRGPSRGNLKSGVANQEGAEDPTQVRIVNRKLAADLNAGDGDIRSIEVRHRAQYKQPQHQEVAYGRKTPLLAVRSHLHFMSIEPARVNMTSNYRFIATICNRHENRKTVSRKKSAACCQDSLQQDPCGRVVEDRAGHVLYDCPKRLGVCYVSISEAR